MKIRMKSGKLTLIPTPISRKYLATDNAKSRLLDAFKKNELLLVEDLKPSRQRWRDWSLPREAIESFVCFNEQTSASLEDFVVKEIVNGRDAVLMSDGGLPVVCDPGIQLVNRLRNENIFITSTQFDNSILLALALSGFNSDQFYFAGFPPREKDDRKTYWKNLAKKNETLIIMDTAYRVDRIRDEVIEYFIKQERYVYFGFELNSDDEEQYWGPVQNLSEWALPKKKNFVLCVSCK